MPEAEEPKCTHPVVSTNGPLGDDWEQQDVEEWTWKAACAMCGVRGTQYKKVFTPAVRS